MSRKLALVPLAAAGLATLLFFSQGGFGGGHGDLDPLIGILGLPSLLLLDFVPLPSLVEGHDLLLIIWWPALGNVILWAGIGAVISKIRSNRAKRAASSLPI